MSAAQGHIGKVYPPLDTYEVAREKIRDFADAINDPNPAYRHADAARALGHPDVVAPPTFAIAVSARACAQLVDDPDLRIDFARVVHGEQRFAYARPLYAGDVVRTTVTLQDVRVVAGNEMITYRADVVTTAGEPVLTATSMLVVRGGEA